MSTPNWTMEYWKNIYISIIYTDFLEFVPAKFNLDFEFVQLFISSYWLKLRIYIVYIKTQNLYSI